MPDTDKSAPTAQVFKTLRGDLTIEQYREAYPEIVDAIKRGIYLSANVTVTRPLGGHEATLHLMTSVDRNIITKIVNTNQFDDYLPLSIVCLDSIGNINSPLLSKENRPKSGAEDDIAEWLKRPVVTAWLDTVGRLPDALHITIAILHNDLQILYIREMEESIRSPFVTKS